MTLGIGWLGVGGGGGGLILNQPLTLYSSEGVFFATMNGQIQLTGDFSATLSAIFARFWFPMIFISY